MNLSYNFYKYSRLRNLKKSVMNFMTSSKFEKTMENLKSNPYYEKYAERIAALQESNPEEVAQKLENLAPKPRLEVDTKQYSSVLNPKKAIEGDVKVEDRKLDAILKLDLVKDKDPSEIQTIWKEYHKDKDVISATIDAASYQTIHENTKKFPTFLFPLPRSHGYEFIVCQNCGHSAHFTPLVAFQVHQENAPECLTVTHYTELSSTKGLVLLRGDYDKNVVDGREAQCLANQFQMYYGGRDAPRLQLLATFNHRPDAFKHMDLIAQLENIPIH